MTTLFQRFWTDEGGTTSIEYGLMLAVLSLVVIGAVGALSTQLSEIFEKIATTISDAVG